MSTPALSVYMPVYNAQRFVAEAIESILAQSFGDFELLLVDDGSTDGTLPILRSFASGDQRVRLLHQPHGGVSAASNHAIDEARGEFLARADADDISPSRRLERQVDCLQKHPNCVAVGSLVLQIDEEGLPLFVMPQTVVGHEEIHASLLSGGWPIAQPACTYRTAAVRAVGGYRREQSLHEDHDLFLRLAEVGELANVPEVLLWYRRYVGSMTFQEQPGSCRIMSEIVSETYRRRGVVEAKPLPFTDANPWGPLERTREWGWLSLKAGHVRTARKYARQTVRLAPLSAQSWKLLYCTLRGR